MKEIKGTAISPGTALGRLYIYRRNERASGHEEAREPKAELQAFDAAALKARKDFRELVSEAGSRKDRLGAELLESYLTMLSDEEFRSEVKELIYGSGLSAREAVRAVSERFAERLEGLEDEYLRSRSDDVRNVASHVMNILSEKYPGSVLSGLCAEGDGPYLLLAEELLPTELMRAGKGTVAGLVTRKGTAVSHTGILARSMGIPTMTGVDIEELEAFEGAEAILDGYQGRLIIGPDEAELKNYRDRCSKERENGAFGQEAGTGMACAAEGSDTRAAYGRPAIYANVSGSEDIEAAVRYGAEGIGLFRTEFLYMKEGRMPDEEIQFQAYKEAVLAFSGREVIIRTFDIGADKLSEGADSRDMSPDYRGLRVSLDNRDEFRTQLRAILRASAFGTAAVMYPMITSVWEVREARAVMEEAKEELRLSGIPFDEHIRQGIMVETPAAALISDLLSREADFFSLGTNDLTAYTMASGRIDEHMEAYLDGHHEAVLRLIDMTARAARESGIGIGICGELAADPELTDRFREMGIDELSVSPLLIPALKERR